MLAEGYNSRSPLRQWGVTTLHLFYAKTREWLFKRIQVLFSACTCHFTLLMQLASYKLAR